MNRLRNAECGMRIGITRLRIADCRLRIDKIGVLLGRKERVEIIAGSCEREAVGVGQTVRGVLRCI